MTLCEKCNQNPASVHYTVTLNHKTTTLHLCAHCAAKMGLGNPTSALGEDLFSSFPLFSHLAAPKREADETCPRCHSTLDQIRKKGVFGCSECYDTFAEKLDLKPFVGEGYRGKKLAESANAPAAKQKEKADPIASLRQKLAQALKEENYEEAARLRDEIRAGEGA